MAAATQMHRPTPLPRGPNTGASAGPHFQSASLIAPGGLNLAERHAISDFSGFSEWEASTSGMHSEAVPRRREPSSVRCWTGTLVFRCGAGDCIVPCRAPHHSSPSRQVLLKLSRSLPDLYRHCNPGYQWQRQPPAKRYLTNPHVPTGNEGRDNANSDLIIAVGDILVAENGTRCATLCRLSGLWPGAVAQLQDSCSANRYVVRDLLGQGTFGQVIKCLQEDNGELVAVKVIKNHPAYYHQVRLLPPLHGCPAVHLPVHGRLLAHTLEVLCSGITDSANLADLMPSGFLLDWDE